MEIIILFIVTVHVDMHVSFRCDSDFHASPNHVSHTTMLDYPDDALFFFMKLTCLPPPAPPTGGD